MGIIQSLVELYETIISKDPCDKCLVKACCKEKCNDKQVLDIFIFPHESLKDKKFFAWLILGSFFATLIFIIQVIYAVYTGEISITVI